MDCLKVNEVCNSLDLFGASALVDPDACGVYNAKRAKTLSIGSICELGNTMLR